MRARRTLAAAALLAIAALAALVAGGCGSSFKLPTEQTANRAAPADKSYQMIATWTGLTGVTDVLLIPGPQLYLAFRGTTQPGRVYEFSTTVPQPLATDRFLGMIFVPPPRKSLPGALGPPITLLHPAALAANATSVFVLDQGDTAAARGFRDPNWFELSCGKIDGVNRTIVDITKYWFVREYDIKGRTLKTAFTDTTFAYVNGVAADAQGRVYVSGVINHCFIDPFDGRVKTLDSEYRIYRYQRGTSDRFVLGAAGGDTLQLGVWGRDPSLEVVEGTGIGSTLDPRGMSWSAVTGAALFFADHGNNEVQKYDPLGGLASSFKLSDCADTTLLVQPTDVDVDAEGNVYVVDAGNQRVFRYSADGDTCVQRVDIEHNSQDKPLTAPSAAATLDFNGTNYVYVVDPPVSQVVIYRRRS
jgi:sugar lactone lactonase YvrE